MERVLVGSQLASENLSTIPALLLLTQLKRPRSSIKKMAEQQQLDWPR